MGISVPLLQQVTELQAGLLVPFTDGTYTDSDPDRVKRGIDGWRNGTIYFQSATFNPVDSAFSILVASEKSSGAIDTYKIDVVGNKFTCNCQDFIIRGNKGKSVQQAGFSIIQPGGKIVMCKHGEAMAEWVRASGVQGVAIPVAVPSAPAVAPVKPSWQKILGDAITTANLSYAKVARYALNAGKVITFHGPPGCGKTWLAQTLAIESQRKLYQVDGMPSLRESSLVGIKTAAAEHYGPVFEAAQAARNGDKTILLFDEFRRSSKEGQDAMVSLMPQVRTEFAQNQGIETDVPIRRVRVPFLETTWAPADNLWIIICTNPWGLPLDPAFMRRVRSINMGFSHAVANKFTPMLSEFIKETWGDTINAGNDMPLEYGMLMETEGPDDMSLPYWYYQNLLAFDSFRAEALLEMAKHKHLDNYCLNLHEPNTIPF